MCFLSLLFAEHSRCSSSCVFLLYLCFECLSKADQSVDRFFSSIANHIVSDLETVIFLPIWRFIFISPILHGERRSEMHTETKKQNTRKAWTFAFLPGFFFSSFFSLFFSFCYSSVVLALYAACALVADVRQRFFFFLVWFGLFWILFCASAHTFALHGKKGAPAAYIGTCREAHGIRERNLSVLSIFDESIKVCFFPCSFKLIENESGQITTRRSH